MLTILDHTSYPHILHRILSNASWEELKTFRLVSRTLEEAVIPFLARKIKLKPSLTDILFVYNLEGKRIPGLKTISCQEDKFNDNLDRILRYTKHTKVVEVQGCIYPDYDGCVAAPAFPNLDIYRCTIDQTGDLTPYFPFRCKILVLFYTDACYDNEPSWPRELLATSQEMYQEYLTSVQNGSLSRMLAQVTHMSFDDIGGPLPPPGPAAFGMQAQPNPNDPSDGLDASDLFQAQSDVQSQPAEAEAVNTAADGQTETQTINVELEQNSLGAAQSISEGQPSNTEANATEADGHPPNCGCARFLIPQTVTKIVVNMSGTDHSVVEEFPNLLRLPASVKDFVLVYPKYTLGKQKGTFSSFNALTHQARTAGLLIFDVRYTLVGLDEAPGQFDMIEAARNHLMNNLRCPGQSNNLNLETPDEHKKKEEMADLIIKHVTAMTKEEYAAKVDDVDLELVSTFEKKMKKIKKTGMPPRKK